MAVMHGTVSVPVSRCRSCLSAGRRIAALVVMAIAAGLLVHVSSPAEAQTEPAVSIPRDVLSAAVACRAEPSAPTVDRPEPVLVVSRPNAITSPDLITALVKAGHTVCALRIPSAHASADDAAQYVVNAIEAMAGVYGGRISVVGYDEGATVALGTLHTWPSAAALVRTIVSIAPRFALPLPLAPDPNPITAWYAKFSASELPAGPNYVAVLNNNDARNLAGQVPVPGVSRGHLRDMTILAVQDPCPLDPPERRVLDSVLGDPPQLPAEPVFSLAYDPVAQHLTIAALEGTPTAYPAGCPAADS
ncbi:hypothetical protein ONR57_16120 [Hoyosella sp. YIM 151337]|uniref:hypothetical protein n=1 Tax=Hoyosella sp. YIM 151337 TaxID=2992742 RepID=UPI002236908B|nr:hypothetical protein [Hoyosella sp. YIM 151337]MCW4354832.1 hypothetical protein [Hoyosella sp. YIM 151337]